MCAFASMRDALEWALTFQLALLQARGLHHYSCAETISLCSNQAPSKRPGSLEALRTWPDDAVVVVDGSAAPSPPAAAACRAHKASHGQQPQTQRERKRKKGTVRRMACLRDRSCNRPLVRLLWPAVHLFVYLYRQLRQSCGWALTELMACRLAMWAPVNLMERWRHHACWGAAGDCM
jgi:hypothetical protein